jgi:hypothetical protein
VLETPAPEERAVAAVQINSSDASATAGHGCIAWLSVIAEAGDRDATAAYLILRAEGILLSMRCRWIIMQVTDAERELQRWAHESGYVEVGGGLLPASPSAPHASRYFDLRHDLLADPTLSRQFGEGSERYCAASSASDGNRLECAVERAPKSSVLPSPPVSKQQATLRTSNNSESVPDGLDMSEMLAGLERNISIDVPGPQGLDTVESLLSGLLSSLNTAAGHADFARLAADEAAATSPTSSLNER